MSKPARWEIAPGALDRLREWFPEDMHEILHVWENEGTYYVVLLGDMPAGLTHYFVRIFKISGKWFHSLDAHRRSND